MIVIDDASTDNSFAVARNFLPHIRLIHNSKNMERSWSRNRAIEQSSGELVALLDADDIWLPDKLEKQIPLFENPDVGLVYSDVLVCKDQDIKTQRGTSYCADRPLAEGCRADLTLLENNSIPTPSAVFRRSCFESVGGFSCQPWIQGCEDYDLWLRLAAHYQLRFLPRYTAIYRIHENQTTANRKELVLRSSRVKWRHVKRCPETLNGLTTSDIDRILYGRLEKQIAISSLNGEYLYALKAFTWLLTQNPLHIRWWRGFWNAAVKFSRRKLPKIAKSIIRKTGHMLSG